MSVRFLLMVMLLIAWDGMCGAAPAPELPVETFFRNLQYQDVELSPSGDCFATLAPIKNRVGLAVIDLKGRSGKFVFGSTEANVFWFKWVNDRQLIFRLADQSFMWGGLLAVNRDGSRPRVLINLHDLSMRFHSLLPDSPDEIRVESVRYSHRDPKTGQLYPHLSRMNTYTGELTRDVTNPGTVFKWIADREGVVRIGVADSKGGVELLHRRSTNAAWETLARYKIDDDSFAPIMFDDDGHTVYGLHSTDGGTAALYSYDLEKKTLKDLLFRHQTADVVDFLYSGSTRKVVGVQFEPERLETLWFDPELASLQKGIDKAFPGSVNRLTSISRDRSRLIFKSTSDRSPGTYHLFTKGTDSKWRMEKVASVADWVDPTLMAEMKPIEFSARDGLKIHGYLTLPKDDPGRRSPVVVLPHGGPWRRDSWGFDPEVQFLANRGCAVLQINFRGSTGYGASFLRAGFRQWGLKMQDDITDGVNWLIGQGVADPARICIYGGSYGGFAALTGLEQTPELYRCGISYAGVTDIPKTFDRLSTASPLSQLAATMMVGDFEKERAQLRELSPIAHVEKIQVPVLLAYGKLDPRVPITTGRKLAGELKKRGHLYELIVKDDEGHGFHNEENRIELWKKIDAFLKTTLLN